MGQSLALPTLLSPRGTAATCLALAGVVTAAGWASSALGSHGGLAQAARFMLALGTWSCVTWLVFLIVKTNLLTPLFLLPSILVARVLQVDTLKAEFVSSLQHHTTSDQSILTEDGLLLDGIYVSQPHRSWTVVWFHANGVPYEQLLPFLQMYGDALDANVLTFNFRGVGKSQGWPLCAAHLAMDGRAAVKHAINTLRLREDRLILHGHSLGGGVVGEIAHEFPDALRIQDRTFRNLTSVARSFMRQLSGFMGIALGCVAGTSLQLTLKTLYPDTSSWLGSLAAGAGAGYVVAQMGWMADIAPAMLSYADWELVGDRNWRADRSLCIYHSQDELILFHISSLFPAVYEAAGAQLLSFELTARSNKMPCHMYHLNESPEEFALLVGVIRSMMQAPRLPPH